MKEVPWRIYLLSLTAGILSAILSRRMLEGIPHISDEISYAFQGRILASGHLWLAPPRVPEAFGFGHILITADRWCSIYPPGWPLFLSIGWLLGAIWIVNPLLLGFTIIGVWRLANSIFDSGTALLSALLFAVSPFVLLMSSGWMSHPAALCFIVWSVVFVIRSKPNFIAAAALAGVAFLIRPFSTIAMIAPFFLWILIRNQNRWKTVLHLAIGLIPFIGIYLIYNSVLFHHPILGGYILDPKLFERQPVQLNFAERLLWYLTQWSHAAWGWPWPDLLILLPALFAWRSWSSNWWLVASPICLLVTHCLYDYRDIVYSGPRYIYEAMAFIAILAARSVVVLKSAVEKSGRVPSTAIKAFVVILLIGPLTVRLPAQIKYHSQIYHGQTAKFISFVKKQQVPESALFLLSGNRYTIGTFYFVNELRPENGSRVFARDEPALRESLQRAYPREVTQRFFIKLNPLPGPNQYHDHWELGWIALKPCCGE